MSDADNRSIDDGNGNGGNGNANANGANANDANDGGKSRVQLGGRADVLDFWRAVELFAGQDVPRVGDARRVYRVGEQGLPWERGHRLRDEWIGDKQAWQHVVYCGVYSLQGAYDEIRERFPSEGDVYDEGPPAGYSALAVFVVDDDGRAILGSQVLASCAWAVARALLNGPSAVGTGKFEDIAARFSSRFVELFDADEDDKEAEELREEGHKVGAVLDVDALEGCLEMVVELLGIDGLDDGTALGGSGEIRIRSRKVSLREAREAGERELLNSFFAADLGRVADAVRGGRCGAALREYLTSAEALDTARRIDVERDVREIRGLLSARRIPGGRWPSVRTQRLALGQQLAVNTILPAEAARAAKGTAGDADARHVFAVNGPPGTGKTVMLRDLVAATVVRRASVLAELERPADAFRSPRGWSASGYRRTVHPLKQRFTGFEMVLACATNAAAENVTVEIPALQAIDSSWQGKVDHFADIATAMLGGGSGEDATREAWALISAALGSRSRNKAFVSRFWFGGFKEMLRTLDGPALEWEDAVADYGAALRRVEDIRAERVVCSDLFDERDAALRESERDGRQVERARELARRLSEVGAQWREAHPDVLLPDEQWEQPRERERREQHPPWVDEVWNEASTELFLAALRLHRAFVEGAADQMHETLAAVVDMLSGKAPATLAPATALAAWQSLFLVVPLVSTTFASFPHLFRHLGQEALGWLLVDEAGQATPQSAAGPIWRAKKVVVVGDPLQLEPISPLPLSIQTILREHHEIPEHRLPFSPSVQRLADQLAPLGTLRGRPGERIWVGAPLNVHRRCEEPMFAIVNDMAYHGQMINCTPERAPLLLPDSQWIDVPGAPADGNWVPAEGEVLDGLLQGLQWQGADFSEVFLISPFRDVAAQIRGRRRAYPGVIAGTIHTAQGREADVVILVLGGNPARPGARAWAAAKPNLLNVAVSRARRRLYVIGDRDAWGRLPHFEVLARELAASSRRHGLSDAGTIGAGRPWAR
jgi:AAA domain